MRNISKIIAVSGAFMLLSCGDASGDLVNLPPTPVPTVTSKLLKKVTTTAAGAPVNTFTYNYTSGKLTTAFDSNNSVSYSLDYSNSQITKINFSYQAMKNYVSNLSYNGSQLSQISGTISPDVTYQATLTYTAGKLTMIKSDYSTLGVPGIDSTKKIIIEYTGENITKATVETQYLTAPSITKTILFSNFDSNPNPYRTLPNEFNIVRALHLDDDAAISGLSVNNYQTITVQSLGAAQTETRTITYDPQTYPLKITAPSAVKDFEYL